MSSYYKYNYNCNYDARNCVSGCCTFYGSCALTPSSCYYTYSDFYSNYSYYYPGSNTTPTNPNPKISSQLGAQYYVQMLAMPIGVSLGYLLLIIIGVIICYCRRKASVQAINRMATHNWWDGSPIIRGNGNDATQPAYGVNPTYPQTGNSNTTSPNIPATARYSSPRKNHILHVNDADMNISMQRFVLKSRYTLPPLQHSPSTSKIVNKNESIQPVGQFDQNLPEISLKTSIIQKSPVQQISQQPLKQDPGRLLKGNIHYEQKKIINQPELKPGQRLVEHTIRYFIEQQPVVGEIVRQEKVTDAKRMEQKEQQQEFAQQTVQPKVEKMGYQQNLQYQKAPQQNTQPVQYQLVQQPPLQSQQHQSQTIKINQQQQQIYQRPTYPMRSSTFDFISQSFNTTFNRIFQNNVRPVKLVSYQPLASDL